MLKAAPQAIVFGFIGLYTAFVFLSMALVYAAVAMATYFAITVVFAPKAAAEFVAPFVRALIAIL